MLIEHLLDLGEDEAIASLSIGELNAFYQSARVKFDADDAFKERSRLRVVTLQSGDPRRCVSGRFSSISRCCTSHTFTLTSTSR